MDQEARQVLWACYTYWHGLTCPEDQRSICYPWVLGTYHNRFGGEFHQSVLRRLATLGFLRQGDTSRGGNRRYYTLVNPDRVAELLGEWGLLAEQAGVGTP